MRVYFSGGCVWRSLPETLIPRRKPHVMLTYKFLHEETRDKAYPKRLAEHLEHKHESHNDPTRRADQGS